MKVRTRSRLILAGMTLVFLISLSFISQFVIIDSFNKIEKQEMTANVQRAVANINNQEAGVAASCKDWADRDETYAFLNDRNLSGKTITFNQPVLLNTLDIDYLFIYDTSGNLVFSESAPTADGTPIPIPVQLDMVIKNSIIPNGMPMGISGRRGMSLVDNEPVILAGYSIRGSNTSDTPRGTLVMVRTLTDQRINNLESVLQLPEVSFHSAAGGEIPGMLTDDDIQKMKKGQILSQPVNSSMIQGRAIITGIENKPTFILLDVQTLRPMYQQVLTSVWIVAAAIILLSAFFIITVQLLLQRFVLGPLSTVDGDIKEIATSGDVSRRMPEKGDDEIRSLSGSLNNMLAELQEKRDELAAARQELAVRNKDLEELNRKANLYLDIYLDVLTYEIVNALMGLRGYAEYLEETASPKEKKFLQKIIDLAQKSNNVIRNIETISRIYKTPPEVTGVELQEILCRETAIRGNAHITFKNCDWGVLANDMLGVIFDNLFSNCLKFGGPDTKIDVTAREMGNGMLEISVEDNGPGISDKLKPHVFDRFAEDSKKRSSYGLGLHIVKMLVESYGGKVWAEDRIPGEASSGTIIRFTVYLAGKDAGVPNTGS